MGSIRTRKDSGLLFFDFRYQGQRCREQTMLKDTVANRKKLNNVLGKIEKEIEQGSFSYADYFPNSKKARMVSATTSVVQSRVVIPQCAGDVPTFKSFTETWVSEAEITWRRSHKRTIMDIINGHLIPAFSNRPVDQITKANILEFRAALAQKPGRKGKSLSPKRINAIMAPLRQILNEAADRYEFNTPYRNIKPLKVPKSDVQPFSLDEVNQILTTVRQDFRAYYTVRFFTGMRTGEIDGLKWQYVDFENRIIMVRETIVDGEEEYTKNDGSQRDIQMSQVVYDALKEQYEVSYKKSEYVFCTREGSPLDHTNVTKRVWYPLLAYLGLRKRRPYQTRHTAATLWLAAGENPEWIARQMGHASTEMLFRVYSRFVPNLTRQDGSAFERLLASRLEMGGAV